MVYYYPNMAHHISTQNESKLKIAKQSYKGVKFIKSCSKLQKLPFKTKVAPKTKSCQKVAKKLPSNLWKPLLLVAQNYSFKLQSVCVFLKIEHF